MSITNQQVIDRALIASTILGKGDTDSSYDSDSLNIFNSMMAEWGQADKDLNWFPQDTIGDICPIPDWAELGVISNLAIELCNEFQVTPPPLLVAAAKAGADSIARTLINLNLEGADMSHLPYGLGRYRRNIENDA